MAGRGSHEVAAEKIASVKLSQQFHRLADKQMLTLECHGNAAPAVGSRTGPAEKN